MTETRTAPARRKSSSGPLISVVIPTDHRVDLLTACLDSMIAQRDAPRWELLVGAPPDPTIHELITSRVPDATIVSIPHGTPAERRNALLPLVTGEIVLFLDDDAVVPDHYLSALERQARENPQIQVFGGPNLTPEGSSSFQVVQGAVLSSLLGAGPVRRRYGARPAAEADERWFTLCNLAIRRGRVPMFFDADLVCGEENEVLHRMSRSGARMLYEPRLWAAHARRRDLGGFAQQMFKYGRGRGQLARRWPDSLRLAHLVPSVTLIGLPALAIAAAAARQPWFAVPIVAYVLAIAAQSLKIATTLRRPMAFLDASRLVVVLHVCYGSGVVLGLVEGTSSARRAPPIHQWHLLRVLVRRQLLLLRNRSLLGLLWPLLTPWVMLALYSFVFHSVLDIPITRYHVFLFAGVLPWSFLAGTLGGAVTAMSAEADLIRRSRFSYAMLPLATEIAQSVYFLTTLVGFVIYLAARGQLVWATLPAILLPIASLYFFVGAVACVLAVIDVYNRDLRQMLNNILTVWFFLVPIVYRQDMLSKRLLFTRSIDPVNLIVGEFRDVLYYGHLSRPLHDVIALFATAGLLVLGMALVRRLSATLPKDV
jgi:ABC-2 type transport system permease protein